MCQKCLKRPPVFRPSEVTPAQVKLAIPERLFVPDTQMSLYYLARDVFVMVFLASVVWVADNRLTEYGNVTNESQTLVFLVARGVVWCLYWWFQSLTFTALWLLAHECGHGAFTTSSLLNDGVGFILHSFLGTPYYSWKYSHRQHHRFNGHLEKDEHYIPKIVDANESHKEPGLWHAIEDTPIFQVVKPLFQQLFGFQSYLLFNVSGQARYPRWTSHFNPYCVLFRRSQRLSIILSDLGYFATLVLLITAARTTLSASAVIRLYGIPWIFLNHWIAMIVSLQHTDTVLPRYRDGGFTFSRGALVTVDREFLGWQGKFFLHCVAHYHVVHHFFPTMPFYHLEEATQYAKKVLGDDYISCDTPVFLALWENCSRCRYVDSKGDIVFYKDKYGSARFRSITDS